jgi:hypothetical protein
MGCKRSNIQSITCSTCESRKREREKEERERMRERMREREREREMERKRREKERIRENGEGEEKGKGGREITERRKNDFSLHLTFLIVLSQDRSNLSLTSSDFLEDGSCGSFSADITSLNSSLICHNQTSVTQIMDMIEQARYNILSLKQVTRAKKEERERVSEQQKEE